MENGETAEEGAVREAYEEAYAVAQLDRLHLLYSLPHINQVYLVFSGELLNPESIKAGEESLDVKLFTKETIPYDQIAFSAVTKALELFFEDLSLGRSVTHRSYFKV
jgi:ADP-ribose pyrophosphatase YjhB (NUDIX family)